MIFILSILMLGIGSASLFAGLFYSDFTTEIFLGMLAPLLISTFSIYWIKNVHQKTPEKLTSSMAKSFFIKMVLIALYFLMIIGFYSFQQTPFVISFTGYFILFYAIEATFLTKLFKQN